MIPVPRGLFALSNETAPIGQAMYAHPAIAGVSLRMAWSQAEPRPGEYAWKSFDTEIQRAVATGKRVMLRVTPDYRTPTWVYTIGAVRFRFTDTSAFHGAGGARSIPVPWDPIFLGRWATFVRAFGARYERHPALALVHLAGPSAYGSEMHLPKTAADRKQWAALGYTPERLIEAWSHVLDAYAAAFPQIPLALNVAIPIADDGVIERVVENTHPYLGARAVVQHNALSAKTTRTWTIHELVAAQPAVGFQLLCPVTPRGAFNAEGKRFGGSMDRAVAIALDDSARYLEIYPADLTHAATARAFQVFADARRG